MVFNILLNNPEFVKKLERLNKNIDKNVNNHIKTEKLVKELLALSGKNLPKKNRKLRKFRKLGLLEE